MNREPSENMVGDVARMAEYELGLRIPDEVARAAARRILSKAKERDALYRVSTDRLARIVGGLMDK